MQYTEDDQISISICRNVDIQTDFPEVNFEYENQENHILDVAANKMIQLSETFEKIQEIDYAESNSSVESMNESLRKIQLKANVFLNPISKTDTQKVIITF